VRTIRSRVSAFLRSRRLGVWTWTIVLPLFDVTARLRTDAPVFPAGWADLARTSRVPPVDTLA